VDSKSVIDSSSYKMDVLGYQVLEKWEGGQTGHFTIDTSTGLLLEGQSSLSMEGTLQVIGREAPVKITCTEIITGTIIR
jgi:hypothetical protein